MAVAPTPGGRKKLKGKTVAATLTTQPAVPAAPATPTPAPSPAPVAPVGPTVLDFTGHLELMQRLKLSAVQGSSDAVALMETMNLPLMKFQEKLNGNFDVLAKMTAESPELQNHEEMKAAIGKVKGVETRLLATVENFGMWQKLRRAIYTAETLDAAIGELMGIYSSWPNRHEESARRPEYTDFFKYGLKLGTEQASLRVNGPT